jgi:hypothetical protein
MKSFFLITTLALSANLMAAPKLKPEQQLTMTVEEIPVEKNYVEKSIIDPGRNGGGGTAGGSTSGGGSGDSDTSTTSTPSTVNDRIDTAGRVISVARDLVALGEAIYELVKKGKPTNVTEYAPISVIPKDPDTKEAVDLFDLEGFSMPVERAYVAKVKNGTGKEVVNFTYKVLFSYGGSYNGAGKYLTGVIIVPQSVVTSFGWEFNASMKMSGMMNHGSKADPVAGVMLTLKYQMNGWSTAYERNDTIHVTGRGEIRNHMAQ